MTKYTCYNGSTETNSIWAEDNKVFYVYKGSNLVWKLHQYINNQLLFESSSAGTYQLNILDDGIYNVICVGGGGGGAQKGDTEYYNTGSGGSGGYSNEDIYLTKGLYTVVVGAGGAKNSQWWGSGTPITATNGGNSSFATVIGGGGGGGGAGSGSGYPFAGAGGTGSTINGNAGKAGGGKNVSYAGGASVYGGYGIGGNGYSGNASTMNYSTSGTSGYVRITYLRDSL